MTPARYFALIPAAGVGARMGSQSPKQYMPLAGKPMLRHAVDAFLANAAVAHTFVVVSESDAYIDEIIPPDLPGVSVLRCGGATRKQSVLNGLNAMVHSVAGNDWILVHDAARPGITCALIDILIAEVGDDPVGGLLALPVVDTVKRATQGGLETVAREGLWTAQTPQMFRHALLTQALHAVDHVTDEASAVEAGGKAPRLVVGHLRNLKITLPSDIDIWEKLTSAMR